MNDCVIANLTFHSFLVDCAPGYDGGLHQTFYLELYDTKRERLLGNVTNRDSAVFSVGDLESGTSYVLIIYSANPKGRSNNVALTAETLTALKRRSGNERATHKNSKLTNDPLAYIPPTTLLSFYCMQATQKEQNCLQWCWAY